MKTLRHTNFASSDVSKDEIGLKAIPIVLHNWATGLPCTSGGVSPWQIYFFYIIKQWLTAATTLDQILYEVLKS